MWIPTQTQSIIHRSLSVMSGFWAPEQVPFISYVVLNTSVKIIKYINLQKNLLEVLKIKACSWRYYRSFNKWMIPSHVLFGHFFGNRVHQKEQQSFHFRRRSGQFHQLFSTKCKCTHACTAFRAKNATQFHHQQNYTQQVIGILYKMIDKHMA